MAALSPPLASLPASVSASSLSSVGADDVGSLLCSLAESGSFSSALRLVLDRQYLSQYPAVLSASVAAKDARIRSICHAHYLEFLASVESLMAVQGDMGELRAGVAQLNGHVQQSAQQVVRAAKAVTEMRRQRNRINEARDVCRQGQYLIQLADKATQQIRKRKYFSALQTLDQLQQVHLPRFADYDFAQQLELEIPFFLDRIKSAVRSEFYSWLSSIRERSQQLGQAAMEHTQKKLQRIEQRRAKQRQRLLSPAQAQQDRQLQLASASASVFSGSSSSMDGASATTSAIVAFAEAEDEDEGLLDAVSLNFAPVYQCLHIYGALSQQHRFARLYKRKRRSQLIAAMELPARPKEQPMAAYDFAFFASVAGFFVLEHSVMQGDNELMGRAEVDGLFDMAVQKVRAVVKEQTATLSSVREFLNIKGAVVALRETMDGYGMRVGGLLDLMKALRERFELIVSGRFQWELKQALKTERWQPLTLHSAAEYRDRVLQYQLAPPLPADASFPVTVSFSSSLPAVCSGVSALIDDYFLFSQYVDDSHTPLLRAVDAALTEHVNAAMLSLIDNSAIHVSQAVQLAINAAAMMDVCAYTEHYLGTYLYHLSTYPAPPHTAAGQSLDVHDIGSASGAGGGSSGSVDLRLVMGGSLHLASRTVFAQTRIRCEDVLFELIDRKIDDFLSALHSPELTPAALALEPSDYVTDLTGYLDSTFLALSHIAPSVRDTLYFTSARHIASSLSAYVLTTLRRLNLLGLYNFNQDVQILENWARRCPVSGLVECFSECRQLMDALLRVDVDDLADPVRRERELPHLSAAKLAKLLDKFKDLPSSAKAPEQLSRLKRRQVDAVLKKLQAQIPQQR